MTEKSASKPPRAPRIGDTVIFRALTHQFAFQGQAEYPAIVTHVDKEGGVFLYALPAFHSPFPFGPVPHVGAASPTAASAWEWRKPA